MIIAYAEHKRSSMSLSSMTDYEVGTCLETSLHCVCVCVWSVSVRECTVLFYCLLCFVLMDGALEWQMALQPADVLSHSRGPHTQTQLYALDHQHVDLFV